MKTYAIYTWIRISCHNDRSVGWFVFFDRRGFMFRVAYPLGLKRKHLSATKTGSTSHSNPHQEKCTALIIESAGPPPARHWPGPIEQLFKRRSAIGRRLARFLHPTEWWIRPFDSCAGRLFAYVRVHAFCPAVFYSNRLMPLSILPLRSSPGGSLINSCISYSKQRTATIP